MLAGVLLILCAMLPYLISFERSKPKARDIVLTAVLTALAVAGRAAFFMLPQIKPTRAIVIVTGICFGRVGIAFQLFVLARPLDTFSDVGTGNVGLVIRRRVL